jgi:hypothetical protein
VGNSLALHRRGSGATVPTGGRMGGPPHEDGGALGGKRHGSRLKPSIGARNGFHRLMGFTPRSCCCSLSCWRLHVHDHALQALASRSTVNEIAEPPHFLVPEDARGVPSFARAFVHRREDAVQEV